MQYSISDHLYQQHVQKLHLSAHKLAELIQIRQRQHHLRNHGAVWSARAEPINCNL